jgi:hypothetical protein
MKKAFLTVSAAIATLLAAGAFAQTDQPGETKAVPSTKPSPTERMQANQERRASGKAVSRSTKTDADSSPDNRGTRKAASKSERRMAAAKRKAEGTSTAKEPKDPTAGGGGAGSN